MRRGRRGVLPMFCTFSGVEVGLKTELYALRLLVWYWGYASGLMAMLEALSCAGK